MIKIESAQIELFKNLAQAEFESVYYDFHNDYLCNNITFNNECLQIDFNPIGTKGTVTLKFFEAEIVKMSLNFSDKVKELTIDNLYRGRFEVDKVLFERKSNNKSFFYLEFYEGQSLEFFCSSLGLEKQTAKD